ncbi:hypothetical protein [Agriterribacter sp.]|uniref:hypothetical protein n=1 Tax=Agriterribacter sp. TaxID=2821509 RepID=UPI002C817DA3|nr:hypothetical protein [Agriterribacter sp.]HTN06045.1 hypothetical protein [Agriterribacter sp.]
MPEFFHSHPSDNSLSSPRRLFIILFFTLLISIVTVQMSDTRPNACPVHWCHPGGQRKPGSYSIAG